LKKKNIMHFVKLLLIISVLGALSSCGDSDNTRTTRAPGESAAVAASRDADFPKSAEASKTPKLSSSSKSGDLGPGGLLLATPPGWHSEQPPRFPESVTVDFQAPRQIKFLGLLRQEGQPGRAPKAVRIEISNDGMAWTAAAGSDNACSPNMPEGWSNIDFAKPVFGRYLKLVIFSNCGDPQLLTLGGLRVD
jgi:hypothetical protein